MHRRRLQSVHVTPSTVPEFMIPDSLHYRRLHTVGAMDLSRGASGPFPRRPLCHHAQHQRHNMKEQSILVNGNDSTRVAKSLCQSHSSFSPKASSALPMSPKTRYRERFTKSSKFRDPFPAPTTRRYCSPIASVTTPREWLGSLADRVQGMLSSQRVSTKTASRAMLRLELENMYCFNKVPGWELGTMNKLESSAECSASSQRQRRTFSSTPYEDIDDKVEEVAMKLQAKNSIAVSVRYRPSEKRLVIHVYGLLCVKLKKGCPPDLCVELTLPHGKKHCVLSAPSRDSSGETLPRTAVFGGVELVSLAFRKLAIRVYTKRRRLLYQTSTPFPNLSLTGDANWVSLNSPKALPSITVCMCYRPYKNKLLVTVVKANNLKKWRISEASYVEVNLLRGSGKQARMETVRTKARYGGGNLVFKEAFSFELPIKNLVSVYTEVSFIVRRRNLIQDHEVLGLVTLSSEMRLRWKKSQSLANTLDEVFRYPGKVITQTHTICQEMCKRFVCMDHGRRTPGSRTPHKTTRALQGETSEGTPE